MHALKYYMIRI